jgi:organic radical activating enzyme
MTLRCAAAYHNLVFDTDGHARLCCNSTEALITDTSVEHALTSQHAQAIQQDLDQGLPHKNCEICWREEGHGDRSYRHSYNEMYPMFELQPVLRTAHIQWDNTCNLTCVYCGPKFSSSWVQLIGERQSYRSPLVFSDQTLAGLTMITFAGGEPTLSKPNLDILNRLLSVNPDCEVIVNTNLTQSIDGAFFNQFLKFKNSAVIASFENTGARFEYVRRGASWQEFQNNFIRLKNLVEKLQTNMIFFPLSAGAMDHTIDWALQHIPDTEIYLNDYTGSALTWDQIGKGQLDTMVEKIVKYADTLPIQLKNELVSKCQQMTSNCNTTNIAWLNQFDQLTNQDHRKIFTELYE